jgi:DNA-binding NarL/FixJ family response regulator
MLHELARGLTYQQIALEIGITPSTVRTHLHNVYTKLGVADRAQAVLTATERGWI